MRLTVLLGLYLCHALHAAELRGITGFVEVNVTTESNLFWWFVPQSEGNHSAPLIVWVQGGPGCTGAMGWFSEGGPYRVDSHLNLHDNPNSWTNFANMLYFDSPVGSGFSYANSAAGYPSTVEHSTQDLLRGLSHVLTNELKEYSNNEIFLVGESFAGIFIPELAVAMLNEPSPLKLVGVAIGNGLSDAPIQVGCHAEFMHSLGLIDGAQAAAAETQERSIINLISRGDFRNASAAYDNLTLSLMIDAGMCDPSDVRYYGFDRLNFSATIDFMNLPNVRRWLGVGDRNFSEICSSAVGARMGWEGMRSVKDLFPSLLSKISVLLFNGNFDFTIPTLGVERWVASLDWPARAKFDSSPRTVVRPTPKSMDTVWAYVRSGGGLTLAAIPGAGHMAAMDQPAAVSDVLRHWMANA